MKMLFQYYLVECTSIFYICLQHYKGTEKGFFCEIIKDCAKSGIKEKLKKGKNWFLELFFFYFFHKILALSKKISNC